MTRELRWLALGAAFIVIAYLYAGLDGALMYAASYAMSLALGIDNVLVLTLLVGGASIPAADRSSVLRWSFAAALGIRTAVLAGTVVVLEIYPPAQYAVGAWFVYAALTSLRADPFATRSHPASRGLLLSIALVDLAYATDALAALAIGKVLFVLVSSNLLATTAIRSLSGRLVLWAPRLRPLRTMTVLLLALAGARLVAPSQLPVTPLVALVVVAGMLGAGLVLSFRRRA